MKLFHGTNEQAWTTIEAEKSLRGPVYLSDDIRVAGYFADWHAQKGGANSLILTIEVDEELFELDDESLLDPIPLIVKRLGIRDMQKYLEDLALCEGATWVAWLAKQHDLVYQHEWQVSLRLANAVKYKGSIGLEKVIDIASPRNKQDHNREQGFTHAGREY